MALLSAPLKSSPATVSALLGLVLLLLLHSWSKPHTELSNILAPHRIASLSGPLEEDNDFSSVSQNHSFLVRRDDYTCGRGNPCANGACCGVSGYCGYGKQPTT